MIFITRNLIRLKKIKHICGMQEQVLWYSKESLKRHPSLASQLKAKIKATGPLTVAEYMKEVVVNPSSGYYAQKESIGPQGDFVTSPEISQLFGEMVAVWIVNEWHKVGAPKPMQLIELGPGKGTLMNDILLVLNHLKQLDDISIHMVELSMKLQDEQARRLCSEVTVDRGGIVSHGTTEIGSRPITWHKALSEVPRGSFSCVIAHEFFDALPIHKFQKTNEGWREVLVDLDPNTNDDIFRYIISRFETPASKLFSPKNDEIREHLEVSLEGGAVMQELAEMFEQYGGFSLLVDYGHDGSNSDTFRGFKKHQLHNPLQDPGLVDLTADVDFRFLRNCVDGKAVTFGPVTQREFLTRMGINVRLASLLQNPQIPEENKTIIKASVDKLINPKEMGERFKFFCMFPSVLEEFLQKVPVSGFVDVELHNSPNPEE